MQVDGDTSTNDTVIALASGLSGLPRISSLESPEAIELQACLDAVITTDFQLRLYVPNNLIFQISIILRHVYLHVEWS